VHDYPIKDATGNACAKAALQRGFQRMTARSGQSTSGPSAGRLKMTGYHASGRTGVKSGEIPVIHQRRVCRWRIAAMRLVDLTNCQIAVYPAQENPDGALLAHLPTLDPPMKLTQLTCFLTFGLLQQGQVISSLSPAKTNFSKVLPQASQQYS